MVKVIVLAVWESLVLELEVQTRNVKTRLDPGKEALAIQLKLERRNMCSLVIGKERVVLCEVLFFVLHPFNYTVLRVWSR